MVKIPKRVFEIAQQLREGRLPRRFKVRAVLKWFGASRRGSNVVADIQATLSNFGLQTEPQLERAGIDDFVRFHLLPLINSAGPDVLTPTKPELPSLSGGKEGIETHVSLPIDSAGNNLAVRIWGSRALSTWFG